MWLWVLGLTLVASLDCWTSNSSNSVCTSAQKWCQTLYFQPTGRYWQGCSEWCSDSKFQDFESRCCDTDLCNDLNMTRPEDFGYSTYLAEFVDNVSDVKSLFQYTAFSETSLFNAPKNAASMIFIAMSYPAGKIVTFFYNAYSAPRIPGHIEFRNPVWFDEYVAALGASPKIDADIGFIQATTTRLLDAEAQDEISASAWQDWALDAVSNSLTYNTDPQVTRIPAVRHPTSPRTVTPDDAFDKVCKVAVSPMSYCPIGNPFTTTQEAGANVAAGRFGLLSQLSRNPGLFYITARVYDEVLPQNGLRKLQIACGEWQYFTLVVPAYTPMVKLRFNQREQDCTGPGETCPLATVYISEGVCPTEEIHERRQFLHHSTIMTFNPYTDVEKKYVIAVSADVIRGKFSSGKIRTNSQIPQLESTECCDANSSFWEYTISVELEEDSLAVWRCILFLMVFAFIPLILGVAQYAYAKRQGVKFPFLPTTLSSGVQIAPEPDAKNKIDPKHADRPTTNDENVAVELVASSATKDDSPEGERKALEKVASGNSTNPILVTEKPASEVSKNDSTILAYTSVFIPDSGLALSSVLLIVGILVWTPSFQYALQLSYLDNDFASICHFNDQCRLDVLLFGWVEIKSFNGVISNFAYLACGLYSIVYIKIDSALQKHKGLTTRLSSRQLSTFYGVGIATFCEGLFSGVYHVCPTLGNFQFDTIMMFFITGTVLMSLFGRRHANSFPQSYFYVCFGGMICTNMFGVYMYMTGYTKTFWAVCLPLVVLASTLSLTHFWYNRLTPFQSLLAFLCLLGGSCGCLPSKYHYFDQGIYDQLKYIPAMGRERKWRLFGMVTIWLMDVLFISFAAANLMYSSDAFLVLSAMNMLVYLGFYITNKIWASRNGFPTERLTWDIYALASCTAIFGIVAAVIFVIPVTNKALPINYTFNFSQQNGSCIFLHFDKHDIWHMLGAVGLSLLTILVYRLDVNSDLDLAKLDAADLKRLF